MEHDKKLLDAADHFMENDETLDRLDQENRSFSAGKYGFMSGAEWQKEQDSDLLKALQDLYVVAAPKFTHIFDGVKSEHPVLLQTRESIIKAGGAI
jgi:hypothetical protein